MRHADVAIVGGGFAGSTAAAMLGRIGVEAVLIDGHELYPKDFRCEKLDGSQVLLLRKTGLEDAVARAATPDLEVWIARFGRVVERKPSAQLDILYQDLVNAIRAEIPSGIEFIHGKAAAIRTGGERQHVMLSNGEEISARLVVLANGLNIGLRHNLGIEREVISPCHSISIGFDLQPVGRSGFDFRALTYYTETTRARAAYLTLFPIGAGTRANFFVYRDMDDPWLREMRRDGTRAMFALMPRLRALTDDFAVHDVKIRPVDLYVSKGHRQAGIVLVGDAFATSCPAAGTGCNKVLTDVERLCNIHVPRWLATPGMEKDKICEFYDDEVKVACDAYSAQKAYYLRSLSIENAPAWHARRWGKFLGHAGKGALRAVGERLPIPALDRAGAPARSSAG
jgi:2-polyprenyl-6-methoxyphenol hydroxylase-like FAD-dependent oxidoreductase